VNDDNKKKSWRWVGYVAAIALLAIIIAKANWTDMWVILKNANQPMLVGMVVLAHFQFVLASIIWRRFLNKGGIFVSLRKLSLIYLVGNFFSTLLPSKYSGDLYRAYAVGRYSGKFYATAATVLLERLSGMFVLLLMGLVASLFAGKLLSNAALIYPIVATFVVFFAGACVLLTGQLFNVVDRFLRALGIKFLVSLLRPLERFHDAVMKYRDQPGFLISTNIIAFVFKIFAFVCIYIGALSLNLHVSFLALILVMPLIYVLEAVPVSIYGIGIREGAFIFFFTQVGLTYDQAFALSIVVLFGRFACALTGGLIYLATSRNSPSPADAVRAFAERRNAPSRNDVTMATAVVLER